MNTDENNNTSTARPFGFWVTAVDRLLRAEFATVFEDEGVTRRDWRMLNVVDDTGASDRPLRGRKLHRLIELGWVERTADGWSLTETGRLAKDRLGVSVQEIRDRIAGAVTPEEFATMSAALEKIARELGWDEGRKLPRGRRFGRHGHAGGFGRGHRGFGHGRGFDRGFRGHERGHECGHGFDRADAAEHPRHGFGERRGFRGHEGHERHGHEGRGRRGFGHPGHRGQAPHIHIHTHG